MTGIHQAGKAAAGLLLGAILLSGCGAAKVPDTIERASLIIEKEGAVLSYTVGVFDRDYYKLHDLQAMAQEEASAYNTAHQTGTGIPVQVSQVTALENGGMVVVGMRYINQDVYRDYNKNTFFYGTVGEAKADGYDFDSMNQVLYDAAGSKSIVSAELAGEGLAGRHLAIVAENASIYCPYKVEYVSEDARVLEDGSVDTTGVDPGAFPVIILMKK